MSAIQDKVEQFRQPEYTGENRCIPCTVVNIVIAAAATLVVGLAAIELAAVVAAFSLVVIYLRGYLVPGTPWLTQRFLPDRVLALFGKQPERTSTGTEGVVDASAVAVQRVQNSGKAVEPKWYLLEQEILHNEDDTFSLAPEFATLFADERENAREKTIESEDHEVPFDRETLATLLDADPEEIEYKDRPHPALEVGYRIRKWPSRSALLSDVAADQALREWADDWEEITVDKRLKVLAPLRLFVDSCPDCGGELSVYEQRTGTCCQGTGRVNRSECQRCEQILLERSTGTDDWVPFDKV